MMESRGRTIIAACGCGHDGRLGMGDCNSVGCITPLPFFLSPHQLDEAGRPIGSIRQLRVGGYHAFAITTTGVYGWGLNEEGQLGLGRNAPPFVASPIRIPFFDTHQVVDVACGAHHTLVWTKDGLYACGGNEDGQLGLPHMNEYRDFTRVLTGIQVNGPLHTMADANRGEEGHTESGNGYDGLGSGVSACPLIYSATLTHISCSTHHSLLAFRDVEIYEEIPNNSNPDDHCDINAKKERKRKYVPVWIGAAGKGDFGELGIDAPPKVSRTNGSRRSSYTSSCFSPAALPPPLQPKAGRDDEKKEEHPNVNQSDACATVVGLQAMHLHSAVTVRENGGQTGTFHWGCYYCNAIEDDAASIPREAHWSTTTPSPSRPVEKEAIHDAVLLHAGNEVLFCCNPISGAMVMGSGVIGLGADDSFVPSWTPLPLPVEVATLPIRVISGRDHFLFLLSHTEEEKKGETAVVVGFGDNLHQQIRKEENGAKGEEEVVLQPTVVLRVGDRIGDGKWTVIAIKDVGCGARHSLFLLDIDCNEMRDE